MKYYKVIDTDNVKWYTYGDDKEVIIYYLTNLPLINYRFIEVRTEDTSISKYIERITAMHIKDKDLKELTLKEFTDNVIDLLAYGVDVLHEQIDKLIKNEKQGGENE